MANRLPLSGYVLGLDVGEARIGAALCSVVARLPRPIDVILASEDAIEEISAIIKREDVTMVVIGIPRNMAGEETAQSQKIRDFAARLDLSVPVVFVDESLSSVRADEIAQRGAFKNASQDSLAACFILEEYLNTVDNVNQGEA